MRVTAWHLASAAALATLALSSLVVSSGQVSEPQTWYAVKGVLPGEHVPDWVHSGRRYVGVAMPGRLVQIFSSDEERSIVLSESLVIRVGEREN